QLFVDGVRWAAHVGSGPNPPTIMVTNVAPSATLATTGVVNELAPVTVTFSNVTDPSSADTAAGFRYSFATSPTTGLATSYATASPAPSAQFTFADSGTYTVLGRVFDKDGGFRDYQ